MKLDYSPHAPSLSAQTGKIQKMRTTVDVADELVRLGYSVAGITSGLITMQRQAFTALLSRSELGGMCSTQHRGCARLSSVWINGIEINFLEMLEDDWQLTKEWKPR